MRSSVKYLVAAVAIAFVAVGCGSAPQADIDAAKTAIEAASTAGATEYAADSLKAAQDAQVALDAELKA
ncbi:MAG: hypothetical protein NTY02_04900, partial [Acidobacteria bacterium]|nr:hypothetical protein [Acidobacteriota bacterium]